MSLFRPVVLHQNPSTVAKSVTTAQTTTTPVGPRRQPGDDILAVLLQPVGHFAATSAVHGKHPMKTGRVTIAGRLSDDLAPGTYNSILKQAGLKES